MSKLNLNVLRFRPVEHKNKKAKVKKIIRSKVYAICVEEKPNVFKAHITIKSDSENPDTLVIPFSPESYNLKGKTKVFTVKQKDSNGFPICVIRNNIQATRFPGSLDVYTPFRNNYVYSGYIITINNKHYFNVETIINHISQCKSIDSSIDLKIE